MRELLIFLENCPSDFKSDVASNIVISAGRYAPNAQWHIDTILKVLPAQIFKICDSAFVLSQESCL
jgi:AP-1 complex subunit gamma-1